jgi:hypothetical protein
MLKMKIESENAALAYAAINREPAKGIPTFWMNIMEHSVIDRLAGMPEGSYKKNPRETYLQMQKNIGVCMIDQYIPDNPLSMDTSGYLGNAGNTTGAEKIYADGMLIESPENVAEHLEKYIIPGLINAIKNFDKSSVTESVINYETSIQNEFGPEILKCGYGQISFPTIEYYRYGYEYYFSAYALYPEIIDRVFTLQGELAYLRNKAVVKAYKQAGLPLYHRLDHDMADGKGVLVNVKTLERAWAPAFIKAISPAADAGFTLLWHCDGNLMSLIPYLLEAGVNGFQGFQYEYGMDYPYICKLKAKNGKSMVIEAGVSVTRELPTGTPGDVRKQLKELVEYGPETGLFLCMSSSCVPGTPYDNISAAIEGMKYYKEHGRKA